MSAYTGLEDYIVWCPSLGGEYESGVRIMAPSAVDAAEHYAKDHLAFDEVGTELEAGGMLFHVMGCWGGSCLYRVRVKVSLEPTFHGARE